MIDSQRETDGKISHETRYYLSNLSLEPKDFNTHIRNHWSIENKLHRAGDPVEIRRSFSRRFSKNQNRQCPPKLSHTTKDVSAITQPNGR